MKKVRPMIGVMGVTPALGLVIPATNVATPATAPQRTTKTVSLFRHEAIAAPCINSKGRTARSTHLTDTTDYSSVFHCVVDVFGKLDHAQTNLEMRTRVYNSGTRVFQGYVHGTIGACTMFGVSRCTYFSQWGIDKVGRQDCIALVNSANIGSVKYGPVCVNM